ncbi:MAG: hypothetical protein HZY79_04955 [Rhodoblastus sp.]|nr:MAG: hypothetical protein HZY79_04955 [Rhodoblastus sp.]
MSDEVGSDPEQQALSQQSHLHAMAIFMGERLAMSVTPELARSLRASFANGLRSQFEADFAEALRSELDEAIVEAFFMRPSALLPEALNSSVASGDVTNNPAKY